MTQKNGPKRLKRYQGRRTRRAAAARALNKWRFSQKKWGRKCKREEEEEEKAQGETYRNQKGGKSGGIGKERKLPLFFSSSLFLFCV
jgi:hypothetical protein